MSRTKTETNSPAPVVEPMLSLDDVAAVLNASRRTAERMRAAGQFPRPDLHVGRMPRWAPATVRSWIASQAGRN